MSFQVMVTVLPYDFPAIAPTPAEPADSPPAPTCCNVLHYNESVKALQTVPTPLHAPRRHLAIPAHLSRVRTFRGVHGITARTVGIETHDFQRWNREQCLSLAAERPARGTLSTGIVENTHTATQRCLSLARQPPVRPTVDGEGERFQRWNHEQCLSLAAERPARGTLEEKPQHSQQQPCQQCPSLARHRPVRPTVGEKARRFQRWGW